MILAQSKLKPQEEADKNDNCSRLLTTGRIYSETRLKSTPVFCALLIKTEKRCRISKSKNLSSACGFGGGLTGSGGALDIAIPCLSCTGTSACKTIDRAAHRFWGLIT
jgi:hypothetical protein